MADSNPSSTTPQTPTTAADLKVTFSREGTAEEVRICSDGDHALMSALRVLTGLDALRAGDKLICEWHRRPNFIERGLA
jgi:hypothetical protein